MCCQCWAVGKRQPFQMAAGETGVCDLDKPCTHAILDDAVMAQSVRVCRRRHDAYVRQYHVMSDHRCD